MDQHIISSMMFCSSIVSARWVPRQLTAELRERRVDACQELLKRFEAEGDGFLGRNVTRDETWSTTTSREPRKRARNGATPPHQNRKNSAHHHLRERLCWLSFGMSEHYMPRGNTVTSATYADLKNPLRPAIKSKRRAVLSIGVLLQYKKCSAPYCPPNCCNNPRSLLRVSSTSAVLARQRPKLFSRLWTTQRGYGRPVFQVRWRDAAGGARVAALSAKSLFFLEVSMHFRSAETFVWNPMETT